MVRKQLSCLAALLCLLSPRGAHGFHAARQQERPLVGSSPLSLATAEVFTTTTTVDEQASTTVTISKQDETPAETTATPSLYAQHMQNHPLVSLVQRYSVTLLSMSILTSAALLTRNVSFSIEALRMRRNILAGCLIFTVGDVGAQVLTHSSVRRRRQDDDKSLFLLNQQRLAISTILGAIWAGITVPYIYDTVERFFPGHGGGVGRILLKMALSCSILSTAGNYITMFFRRFVSQMCNMVVGETRATKRSFAWSAVRGHWMQCVSSCNRDFFKVLRDDLKIWPLYDMMCFAIIPPALRPITTALMSSAWSMYMSIAAADHHEDKH